MKRKTSVIFLLVVMLLSMGYTVPITNPTSSQVASSDQTTTIDVTFANYTDLDDDGVQDDVYATVDVTLDGGVAYTLDYLVSLTLPSGKSYSYFYKISTNYQSFTLINYFFDHATESGWYTLNASVVLQNGGKYNANSSLVFDPPGGSGGGDPDHSVAISD